MAPDKSKSQQLVDFLSRFGSGEFNIRKLARAFRLQPSSVQHIAALNPNEMKARRGMIIKLHPGGTTRTNHEVRREGQPKSSLRREHTPKRRVHRGGRGVTERSDR